jgi:glycosyltransferase involved in cell wall biosynthesis
VKIVVLASRFPYPLEKGDKLRLYYQLKYLAVENEVLLLCLSDQKVKPQDLNHLLDIGIKVEVYQHALFHKIYQVSKAVISGIPFQVAVFYHSTIHRKINDQIATFNPDILYCQLLRMAPYTNEFKGPKVLDYMDAFGYSMQKRKELVSFPLSLIYTIEARRMDEYERLMFHQFNKHIIISEQDKKRIHIDDNNSIEVVSNGVDFDFFNFDQEKIDAEYDIGIVGNLGYLPNIEASIYIAKSIQPLLPDTKVLICGARPHQSVINLSNEKIVVSGWVKDIRTAYRKINIFIAPIFSGTGQQNKILEAMAMGVPAITTPEVNTAIGGIPGKHILIASNPREFAEKIKLLQSNKGLYNDIKNNALTFVKENYGWRGKVDHLIEIFKST